MLTDALAAVKHRSTETEGRLRCNRGTAYRLSGDFRKAATDYGVAHERLPHNAEVAKRYALVLAEDGNTDAAIRVLNALSSNANTLENRCIRAGLLAERNRGMDREQAINVLRTSIAEATDAPLMVRADILATLCKLQGLQGDHDDALAAIQGVPEGFLTDALACAIQADVLRRSGAMEEAKALARRAAAAIDPSSMPFEKHMIADALTRAGQPQRALPIWKDVVEPTHSGPDVDGLLECARQCEEHDVILEFCASLRKNGIFDPCCAELEVATLQEYEDPDQSIAVMQTYLDNLPDNQCAKVFRVRLGLLGIKLRRPELIECDLSRLPTYEEAEPPLGLAVVEVARHGPDPMSGVRYAYELLRRNFGSPEAHAAMILAVGIAQDVHVSLPEFSSVEVGSAIQFREAGVPVDEWLIIEDSEDPDSTRHEYAPESSLASELLHKSVGDEFFRRKDDIQPRKATIHAITSKYQHRAVDSMEHWEERFPDNPFIRKYKCDLTTEGVPDIAPMLRHADLDAKLTDEWDEFYRSHPLLSTTVFAKIRGISTIESTAYLGAQADLPIRCCRGTEAEFTSALEAMQTRYKLVVDPSAIATLFVTGIFRQIDALGVPCMFVFASEDDIRECLLGEHSRSRARTLIGKHGDKYVRHERSEEEIREYSKHVESFLTWLATVAEKRGGLALASVEPQKRSRVVDILGQPSAQSIALAQEESAVLWTDDLAVADIAASEFGVPRTWSQVTFKYLVQRGGLAREICVDFSVKLLVRGYCFTQVDAEMVVKAAVDAHWIAEAPPLREMLGWFGNSTATFESLLGLLARTLPLVFRRAPLAHQRDAVSRALLERVKRRSDGERLLRLLHGNVRGVFGVDVLNADVCERLLQRVRSAGKD